MGVKCNALKPYLEKHLMYCSKRENISYQAFSGFCKTSNFSIIFSSHLNKHTISVFSHSSQATARFLRGPFANKFQWLERRWQQSSSQPSPLIIPQILWRSFGMLRPTRSKGTHPSLHHPLCSTQFPQLIGMTSSSLLNQSTHGLQVLKSFYYKRLKEGKRAFLAKPLLSAISKQLVTCGCKGTASWHPKVPRHTFWEHQG